MLCPKCCLGIPDDALLCCYCGRKIVPAKRTKTKRANGTGYIYPRGKTWTVRVVDHYLPPTPERNYPLPVWKTKGGFPTKKEAVLYVTALQAAQRNEHPPKSFLENFTAWRSVHESRVSEKTMEGYLSVMRHFQALHSLKIDTISVTQLQACIDGCGHGKRTKQLMKVVAGLIYRYAIGDKQITTDITGSLWTGNDETGHYDPLTEEELARVESSGLEYADYVVAMCYLGHRPSELFSFTKADYHEEDGIPFITGGVKTEAGRTRSVTIPPHVLPIIRRQLALEGTDLLFPRLRRTRKGEPDGFDAMPVRYFNKFIWQPMMAALGITGKVPYATRHTFANKIKAAAGDERDKAGLMGHASYETTRRHYQTTTLAEKQAITDQLG